MKKVHLMKKVPDGKGGVTHLGNVGACGTMYCTATHVPARVTCERCKLRVKYGQRGDKISTPNATLHVPDGSAKRGQEVA